MTIKATTIGQLRTYRISADRQVELRRVGGAWQVVTLSKWNGKAYEDRCDETPSASEARRWVRAEVKAEYKASLED